MKNTEGFAERVLQGDERRRVEANRRQHSEEFYGARSRLGGVVPDRRDRDGGSGLNGSRLVFGGA